MLNYFPNLLVLDDTNIRMTVLEILIYLADARGYTQVREGKDRDREHRDIKKKTALSSFFLSSLR